MSSVLPHACNHPGCPNSTRDRYCPVHAKLHRQEYDRRRGSAYSRGYDAKWNKRRLAFLKTHPICEYCGKRKSTCVDHIIPLPDGPDDESNWKASCASCHSRKTIQHDGGFGRPKTRR